MGHTHSPAGGLVTMWVAFPLSGLVRSDGFAFLPWTHCPGHMLESGHMTMRPVVFPMGSPSFSTVSVSSVHSSVTSH